jgi:manganese transport protein
VLSFGIPFALVPLWMLTRRADIMGPFVNRPITTLTLGFITTMIVALNVYLIFDITR